MNLRPLICLAAMLLMAVGAFAQSRSSPAFAEVLLRKTELLAEAEALSADYTDTNPKMLDLRHEVAGLDKFLSRILASPSSEQPRLTLALGKLMVRRASLDTEFLRVSRTLNTEHSDYKRAKKRLEIFDAAIKEIFP